MRIITGRARGLKLATPKSLEVRPTADRVKETVFNIIGTKILGADVLDMFAGTGNLGLESWSRGAKKVVFIDKSAASLQLVTGNIRRCRADSDCAVLKGDALAVVRRLAMAGTRFDLAFCDPPYNKGLAQLSVRALAETAFLKKGGYLIVERSTHDELTDLPACCSLERSSFFGETVVDFLYYGG